MENRNGSGRVPPFDRGKVSVAILNLRRMLVDGGGTGEAIGRLETMIEDMVAGRMDSPTIRRTFHEPISKEQFFRWMDQGAVVVGSNEGGTTFSLTTETGREILFAKVLDGNGLGYYYCTVTQESGF